MKRKAILIGNTRNLSATPLDLLKAASFLMSNKWWSMEQRRDSVYVRLRRLQYNRDD